MEIYLHFKGNCRETIEFYANVFGITMPQISYWGDAPAEMSASFTEDAKKLVMNARMNINGTVVMFSDVPVPQMPVIIGNNINLVANIENIDELKSVFNSLKNGGTVVMELNETFWSKCYGMVTDKFGITWHLNLQYIEFEK